MNDLFVEIVIFFVQISEFRAYFFHPITIMLISSLLPSQFD